ncbi:MAG TPA: hypothetical protein VFL78_10090 [Rhodanobacteraceae bacterium]|nr:hypothetical protein [Rhodanobacteraceae bacterium]
MDWNMLLRFPSTVLLILAAVALLWALVQLIVTWRRLRARRHMAAGFHGLVLLVACALGLMLAGLGASLHGYRFLSQEQQLVALDAQHLAPQRWAMTLTWPDGRTRHVRLAGDDFRIEAVVLKWQLPAVLAGVPPLYRLDRLEGRYEDPAQEATAPRTVIDLRHAGYVDLLALREKYTRWLFQVDTVYGSGAYLPLVQDGHYTVSLMRTGALVARPDPETVERISRR